MHFGENQLSPRSFGISPLPTAPLTVLQHGTVRASTPVSGRFTLAMGSSRGFGSLSSKADQEITLLISIALFRLAFAVAPVHKTFATQRKELAGSFFNRHAITLAGSDRLSAHGCRFSFTPLPGFFSPFPHGTLRYRSPRLFSLGTWSSQFPTRFLVSGGTHGGLAPPCLFALLGSHHLWRPLPGSFA
jgi:hypothetical protein